MPFLSPSLRYCLVLLCGVLFCSSLRSFLPVCRPFGVLFCSSLRSFLPVCRPFHTPSGWMDRLVACEINLDLTASEFERNITQTLPDDSIKCIRDSLFLEALEAGLASSGDALAQRRKTNGGKSVKQKHITDIWYLVHSIRSNTSIPRTLLRNGKRSKEELSSSQARHQGEVNTITDTNFSAALSCNNSATQIPQIPQEQNSVVSGNFSQTSTTNDNGGRTSSYNDTTFRSTVVHDIGNLKASVDDLKREVQELKSKVSREPMTRDECSCCLMYLRLKNSTSEKLDKSLVELKVGTSILGYEIIRAYPTPAFRVKILKSVFHNAITHARSNDCVADIWRGKSPQSPLGYSGMPETTQPIVSVQHSLTITSWNCRGFSSATPYLSHILGAGSDVVILSEHWLWPYELHKLNEADPRYQGYGKSDSRLTDRSDNTSRGCGGVGMLWKKITRCN